MTNNNIINNLILAYYEELTSDLNNWERLKSQTETSKNYDIYYNNLMEQYRGNDEIREIINNMDSYKASIDWRFGVCFICGRFQNGYKIKKRNRGNIESSSDL